MAINNLKEIDRKFEQFKREQVEGLINLHTSIAIEFMRKVRVNSPVWTGRYRASHRIGIGAPDGNVAEPHPDPPPWPNKPAKTIRAPSIGSVRQVLLKLEPFQTVFISNNLPYAKVLEFGDSRRAPRNIYGKTVTAISAKFQNVTTADIQNL